MINEDLKKLLPEKTARELSAVPIECENGTVTIMIPSGIKGNYVDSLMLATGKWIKFVHGDPSEIKNRLNEMYGEKASHSSSSFRYRVHTKSNNVDISNLKRQLDVAPVVKLVDEIITSGIHWNASDIHIEPYDKYVRVRYRIDGKLTESNPIPYEQRQAAISRIKVMAGLPRVAYSVIPAFMGSEFRIPMWKQLTMFREGNRYDITTSNAKIRAKKLLISSYNNVKEMAIQTGSEKYKLIANKLLGLIRDFDFRVWVHYDLDVSAENKNGLLLINADNLFGGRSDVLLESYIVHEAAHMVFDDLYPNARKDDYNPLAELSSFDIFYNEMYAHVSEFEYYEFRLQRYNGDLQETDFKQIDAIKKWRSYPISNSLDHWEQYFSQPGGYEDFWHDWWLYRKGLF